VTFIATVTVASEFQSDALKRY